MCVAYLRFKFTSVYGCVCKTMSMYRKYLLKRNFWAVPRKDGKEPNCYVKHDIKVGGIYAFIQHRGCRIVANNKETTFNNFNDLDLYLDRLVIFKSNSENSDFLTILNRRNTTKLLRQIPF